MRFMRLTEVIKNTGLGRSSIYKRIAEGEFPNPCRLGEERLAGYLMKSRPGFWRGLRRGIARKCLIDRLLGFRGSWMAARFCIR